jgi:hypothetical protein
MVEAQLARHVVLRNDPAKRGSDEGSRRLLPSGEDLLMSWLKLPTVET